MDRASGPPSYNGLLAAAARGEIGEIVDAPVGWILAEDVALGPLLAYEQGTGGRRYLPCGEVAPFSRVLDTYCRLAGSPGSSGRYGSTTCRRALGFTRR